MQNKSNQSTIIYLVDLIYFASVIIQEHSVVELYKKKVDIEVLHFLSVNS
jgi:hypothetical protein